MREKVATLENVLSKMSAKNKQHIMEVLNCEGFNPVLIYYVDSFDQEVLKLIGNKHRLTTEQEEIILNIVNSI